MSLAWPAVVQLLVSFTLAHSRISHEYASLFIIVINLIFSSLELWLTGELIVRLASVIAGRQLLSVVCRLEFEVCRLSTFSNQFSSETSRPIEVKFHVEHDQDSRYANIR